MNLNRRQFLAVSGAALPVGLLATEPFPSKLAALAEPLAAGGTAAAAEPWHRRLRRIGQVNFNERDPVELDVRQWADYWASLKIDAVLVSVTGITAFYPTDVPFHRRSPYLGDRDLFQGECEVLRF